MARRTLLLAATAASALAVGDPGIIKLDNLTFPRLVDGSRAVMARFDKEYSYGDDHDAWKAFGKEVSQSSADILVVDVGVSEYGDKENSDLAEKFGAKTDDFPQFRLFKKGTTEPVKYSGKTTKDDLMRYVQTEAGVWVGLAGQVKEFDALAKQFIGGDAAAAKAAAQTAAAAASENDAESAKYYCKVMEKGSGDPAAFVKKEATRLEKMLADGSVKATKKEQFGRRLNILSSFA